MQMVYSVVLISLTGCEGIISAVLMILKTDLHCFNSINVNTIKAPDK